MLTELIGGALLIAGLIVSVTGLILFAEAVAVRGGAAAQSDHPQRAGPAGRGLAAAGRGGGGAGIRGPHGGDPARETAAANEFAAENEADEVIAALRDVRFRNLRPRADLVARAPTSKFWFFGFFERFRLFWWFGRFFGWQAVRRPVVELALRLVRGGAGRPGRRTRHHMPAAPVGDRTPQRPIHGHARRHAGGGAQEAARPRPAHEHRRVIAAWVNAAGRCLPVSVRPRPPGSRGGDHRLTARRSGGRSPASCSSRPARRPCRTRPASGS